MFATPSLMSFLTLVHRFPPLVDSRFIPCSGCLMGLDSHVHLTAGQGLLYSYKLVMLRSLSGYIRVWR